LLVDTILMYPRPDVLFEVTIIAHMKKPSTVGVLALQDLTSMYGQTELVVVKKHPRRKAKTTRAQLPLKRKATTERRRLP
jgi:hypothetical protein